MRIARDLRLPALWLAAIGMIAAILLPFCLNGRPRAAAQSSVPVNVTPAGPQQPVSLRDRLIVGLKAMSPADVAFVDNVVFRVRNGQLPQRLVDQTFFWARERASRPKGGRDRRPIIYFRPAMASQAERLGVTL
jgi:hypothetical protein